ncbi:MAG: MOSC domain-containing protein [Litorilinea sp.]
MIAPQMLTLAALEAGLDAIRQSPRAAGTLDLIVRRPAVEARERLDAAELDSAVGMVGDNWATRGSSRTSDGSAHPDMQLTLMNSRAIALVAQERARWPLAGDQLYVDLDLSVENLPPGTRLAIGAAVLEITPEPHMGCKKFAARFGVEALQFVNSSMGQALRLRGVNTRVVQGGPIRVGDAVQKLPAQKLPE